MALYIIKAAADQESWGAGWLWSLYFALYNTSGCCQSRDRIYRPVTSAGNKHVEGRPFPTALIITILTFYFCASCSWSLSLGWVTSAASLPLAQPFPYTTHCRNYPASLFLGLQNAVLSALPTNPEPNCQKSCMCCPDSTIPGKKDNLI